jgi:hypothetical protein
MVWLAVDSRTYMIGVVKTLLFGWASPDCFALLDVAIKSELFFIGVHIWIIVCPRGMTPARCQMEGPIMGSSIILKYT